MKKEITFPCEVGDKLYKLMQAGGRTVIVKSYVIAIQSTEKNKWVVVYQNIGSTVRHRCDISEIGKTIYLKRKEAENALKGGAE